jgi:hypothetical protein
MNRIYIETPIDQTEGLEDGRYTVTNGVAFFDVQYDKHYGFYEEFTDCSTLVSYLRSAPDNSVVVSATDFENLIEYVIDHYEREIHNGRRTNLWLKNEDGLEYTTKEIVNQFIQTKLAQMGGKEGV